MSGTAFDSSEIEHSAEAFAKAGANLVAVVKSLDDAASKLEKSWGGASQQEFFQNYNLIRTDLLAYANLLKKIQTEMRSLAAKLADADKE